MIILVKLLLLISFVCLIGPGECKDCKINQNGNWFDPANVYECPDDKTCCIESENPSCCGDKPVNDQVMDQVKLWGCVVGAALAIGILICCCRKESNCCNEDATCKSYLTCGCCKSPNDVAYQKFTPPSPSSSSLNSYNNNKSVLSVNKIDNLKLVSPNEAGNEAHLQ